MSTGDEVVRCVRDKNLHVIFRAGEFESLPTRIRSLGPWQGLSGGAVEDLKPHLRLQLAEQGFALVYQNLASFTPRA
jgi:hypothetical protein